jgi:hypothetical protein
MRFRTALFLTTLFLACFTVAAWSSPLNEVLPSDRLPAPDSQSLSGTISAIGDAQFSVDVTKEKDVKTVEFLVDDRTRVEGKLTVGAVATVQYRSVDGKNIAVHVVVTPSSGKND